MISQDLLKLLKSWDIHFNNTELLREAFEHSSFQNERRVFSHSETRFSNERLEFLGDSVLGMIVCEALMRKSPQATEGELSRLKSIFVSEKSLSTRARTLGLGPYLQMSRGERLQGGQDRDSTLADLVEAFLAAVYLDQGLEILRKFCLTHLFPELSLDDHQWHLVEKQLLTKDSKSLLQEMFQQKGWGTPRYVCIKEHSPQGPFTMGIYVGEIELERIKSDSKKDATHKLAQQVLALGPQKIVEFLRTKGFMTSGSETES